MSSWWLVAGGWAFSRSAANAPRNAPPQSPSAPAHPDGGAEELFPQKRSFSFEKRPFFSCFTGFGDTGFSGSGFGTVWWG